MCHVRCMQCKCCNRYENCRTRGLYMKCCLTPCLIDTFCGIYLLAEKCVATKFEKFNNFSNV